MACALILVILVPLIQGQVIQLIASIPAMVRSLQDHLANLVELLQQRLPAEDMARLRDMLGAKMAEALTWLALLLQSLITSSLAILNILSLVIVTPIVTFFLLRDWEKMVAVIDSYLPRPSLETVRGQARLVSDTLVGFIHGQALICLILAAYYASALSVAGLNSALAIGVLIGVLAIIPILGVTTGFILALSLAASQYGTWTADDQGVRDLRRGADGRGEYSDPEAARGSGASASGLGHLRAVRRRHAVRLYRRFAGRAGGGGDRRAGALRAGAISPEHAL